MALLKFTENPNTILDIEAGEGERALAYAEWAESANIYAFESDVGMYAKLSRNLASTGFSNVTIFNNSIRDSIDEKRGWLTVDSLALTSCDAIVIGDRADAKSVVEGAASTIARHAPLLVFEGASCDAPDGYVLVDNASHRIYKYSR